MKYCDHENFCIYGIASQGDPICNRACAPLTVGNANQVVIATRQLVIKVPYYSNRTEMGVRYAWWRGKLVTQWRTKHIHTFITPIRYAVVGNLHFLLTGSEQDQSLGTFWVKPHPLQNW